MKDVEDGDIRTAGNRVGRRIPDMVVDGVNERDILDMAPSFLADRVHWTTEGAIDVTEMLHELPVHAYTRKWSDEQHRIWVKAGEGAIAREATKQWCIDRRIEPLNLRVESSVPFRDVESIPTHLFQGLILATVEWLYPRTYAIRRKLTEAFELIDDEDVHSMMYLFVSDHADRFDAGRVGKNGTLNFATFMLGKLRKWPQDAARTAYGRNVVDDRMYLNQHAESTLATEYRRPHEAELAQRLGTDITDLRQRQLTLATVSGMRHYQSIVGGGTDEHTREVDIADDELAESESLSFATNAALTRELVHGACTVSSGRGKGRPDPLALAAVYLTFWEQLSRNDVAAEFELSAKSVNTAMSRLLGRVRTAGEPGQS